MSEINQNTADLLTTFVSGVNKKPVWEASDLTGARYMGEIEIQDKNGGWNDFYLYHSSDKSKNPNRFIFGWACNAGFLESGYLQYEPGEYEAADDLMVDLHNYYNCGPESVSRIIVNERM